MRPSSRWWWDLSTREFSMLDMEAIVAILPVGAVEQHGPHLPVRVDAAINAGIVARAVERAASALVADVAATPLSAMSWTPPSTRHNPAERLKQ